MSCSDAPWVGISQAEYEESLKRPEPDELSLSIEREREQDELEDSIKRSHTLQATKTALDAVSKAMNLPSK